MKWLRLAFAVIALALLAYGLFLESHETLSPNEEALPQELSGAVFNEMTTFDGLVLIDGRLYDAYSLGPEDQEAYCST